MIAYIILAHKNITQLQRLVNQIYSEETYIIIHIDKKISNDTLKELKEHYKKKSNIFFLDKRYNCVWGDFSIIKATNECIDHLVNIEKDFSHGILISGMDFPIKSNEYIRDFLKSNKNKNFIECSIDGKYKEESKYNIYYFKYAHLFMKPKIHKLIFRAQYKLSYMLNIKRKHPYFDKVYFGSQWWALSKDTLIEINQFIKNNKKYIRFYKNTNIPDEYFYHTIIGNKFLSSITNFNLEFMEWEDNSWHPNVLTMKDIEKIEQSSKLFARKFDINVDEKIISYLEDKLK